MSAWRDVQLEISLMPVYKVSISIDVMAGADSVDGNQCFVSLAGTVWVALTNSVEIALPTILVNQQTSRNAPQSAPETRARNVVDTTGQAVSLSRRV
jgi:hypothetical protein